MFIGTFHPDTTKGFITEIQLIKPFLITFTTPHSTKSIIASLTKDTHRYPREDQA